ncbi:MAG: hypothetical protein WBB36_12265, partial [Chitinophagales bacterium]
FAYFNEGGIIIADKRALNVKNEIIKQLSAAKLSMKTKTGTNRFFPKLSSLVSGISRPNTSDPGRIVKVYLFHKAHSAGP